MRCWVPGPRPVQPPRPAIHVCSRLASGKSTLHVVPPDPVAPGDLRVRVCAHPRVAGVDLGLVALLQLGGPGRATRFAARPCAPGGGRRTPDPTHGSSRCAARQRASTSPSSMLWAGALSQERHHRVGRITQERHPAARPGLERWSVEHGPLEDRLGARDQRPHLVVPPLEQRQRLVTIAACRPGLFLPVVVALA